MDRTPALDGIRAAAIAMIVAYHVDDRVVPAGYWGVILFFVLSGYLITRVLTAEEDRTGRIDVRAFYARRALRVLPPLVVFCAVLFATGTDWSRVAATLGFYANYARVDGMDLGLLTHTWFVAIVGHFYVVWPLVIAAVPRRHRVRVVGVLALAAIVWRVVAIQVASPGWVYNATDTNAAALLAGAYLGVARPGGWRWAGWSLPAVVALSLIPAFGERGAAFLWADFLALALGVLVLQHALTRPRWLEVSWLVSLGQVSYGLYLWHYVFVRIDIPLWTAVPLTAAATAGSWYLVEQPVQALRDRFRRRRRTPPKDRRLTAEA
ncbi:MAG: acyltransferase [Acidimicrobiia bacterium]|nr:acyltransferase [Acidimicrobiia bacterium]